MARINNLTNFLNDVATAIKTKLGDNTPIPASQFDTKIGEIETGGTYQSKTINISANGSQTITPDTGYDALSSVVINVQVPVKQLQSKTYEFTQNTHIILSPEQGYDGFSSIDLTINVPSSGGIQEYASVQAMKEAGLGDGEKAIVYNTTNKLEGYYQVGEEEQFLFPKITDCTINSSDKTILYDYTNAIGMANRSDLATKIGAIMTSAGWISGSSFLRFGNILILWEDGDLYAYVIYRRYNGTEYSNNEPSLVYLNNQMYFSYNAGNANTNLRLKKFKLNLDESTYEEIETFTPTSTRPYNSNSSTQHIFGVSPSYIPWSINATINNIFVIRNVIINTPVASSDTSVSSYTITPGERVQNREVYTILDTGLKYGSSDANATANDIVAGKSGYVNGVKILGTRGGGTIRQYDSLEDLEEDTEIQNGELALVYKREFIPFVDYPNNNYQNGKIKVLQNVVFDTAISSNSSLQFNTRVDNSYTEYYLQLTSSGATLRYRNMSSYNYITLMTWTTSDSLTYVADKADTIIDNIYELYASSSSYADIKQFIEVWNCIFTGIYEHTSSGNVIAKTQLTIDNANDLYNGEIGYGKNGIITGDGSIMRRFSTSELDDLYMSSSYKKSNKTSLIGNFPEATNNVELQYYEFTNKPLSQLDNLYYMALDYNIIDLPNNTLSQSKINPSWYRWIDDKLYIGSYEYIYDSTITTYTQIVLHVSIYDSTLNQFSDYTINLPAVESSSLNLTIYYIDPTTNQIWLIQRPYASEYRTVVDYTLKIYNYFTGELVQSIVLTSGYSFSTYGVAKDSTGNYMYLQYLIYDNTSSWGYNKIVRYDITTNTLTTLYSYASTASSSNGTADQWRRYDIIEHEDCTILFNNGKISYINHGETTEHTITTLAKTAIENSGNYAKSINIAYTDGNYIYVSLYTLDDPTEGSFGFSTRRLYRFNKNTSSDWEMLYEPTDHDYTLLYSEVIDDNGTKYYACGSWYYLDSERWITASTYNSNRTDFDYYSGVYTYYSHFNKVGNYLGLLRLDTSNKVIKQRVFANIIDYSDDTKAIEYVQKDLILSIYKYSNTAIPLGNISINVFQNNKYLDTIIEEEE